jgi:hypothetical protein
MPSLDALLGEYLRESRQVRRAVSRDLARAHPVPTRRPTGGAVGRLVHARRPLPVQAPTGRSGQARINAKRKARAAYWGAFTNPLEAVAAFRADLVEGRLAVQFGWTREQIESIPEHLRAYIESLPAV